MKRSRTDALAGLGLVAALALLHLMVELVAPEQPAPAWQPPDGCWTDACALPYSAPGRMP